MEIFCASSGAVAREIGDRSLYLADRHRRTSVDTREHRTKRSPAPTAGPAHRLLRAGGQLVRVVYPQGQRGVVLLQAVSSWRKSATLGLELPGRDWKRA
jgi:hypothetical protein